jgi:two-component system invasion response regulator UvrY
MKTTEDTIKIAVVDDHHLFRSGLVQLITSLGIEFKVVLEAENGKTLLTELNAKTMPHIAMIDINMPVMNGFETVEALKAQYPDVRVLVVTMNDDELSLIKMLKLGVKGYVGKDVEPSELRRALTEIHTKGFYYTDDLTSSIIKSIQSPNSGLHPDDVLSSQELKFIELACSEDTYAQIADKMCLSPKTIDGYRAAVFEKLQVKSRVGLVIYALKRGLVVL